MASQLLGVGRTRAIIILLVLLLAYTLTLLRDGGALLLLSGAASSSSSSSSSSSAPPPLDARRAAFAASASQCGHNYLELAAPPLSRSPPACAGGLLRALSGATRRGRDAPIEFPAGCGLKWYTSREACALVASAGSLLIIGDSLQRHLAQALMSVLSGNLVHGAALPHKLPGDAPHLLGLCACDKMYDDHAEHGGDRRCRDASAANLGSEGAPGPQTLVCPNWRRNHVHFQFVAASEKPGEGDTPWTFRRAKLVAAVERMQREAAEVDAAVAAAAPAAGGGDSGGGGGPARPAHGSGVFIHFAPPVLHVGMAQKDLPDVTQWFVEPLWEALRKGGAGGRRRAVCAGLHARQANGPPQYMEKQGNHAVQPYNVWLGGECERTARAAGVGVGARARAADDAAYAGLWDTYAFTFNHSSPDGAHYDSRVNVMLAQLLLNVLEAEMF
jgi:hypothetical protein